MRNSGISKSPLYLDLSRCKLFIVNSLPDVSGPIPPEGLCKCITPTGRLTGENRCQVNISWRRRKESDADNRQHMHSVEYCLSLLRHLCCLDKAPFLSILSWNLKSTTSHEMHFAGTWTRVMKTWVQIPAQPYLRPFPPRVFEPVST